MPDHTQTFSLKFVLTYAPSVPPHRSWLLRLLAEPEVDAETEALMHSELMPRAPSPFTKHKGATPVPTRQILCLLALAVAEPIHATQIQPYLPQVCIPYPSVGYSILFVSYN